MDETRLGFADFRGNRQYLTVGNVAKDDRVALFLMDYGQRRRLKLLGRLAFVDDPEIVARVRLLGYAARVERAARIEVVAFDWNGPQHITPRFTEAEITAASAPLHDRIATLESENQRLRATAARRDARQDHPMPRTTCDEILARLLETFRASGYDGASLAELFAATSVDGAWPGRGGRVTGSAADAG